VAENEEEDGDTGNCWERKDESDVGGEADMCDERKTRAKLDEAEGQHSLSWLLGRLLQVLHW